MVPKPARSNVWKEKKLTKGGIDGFLGNLFSLQCVPHTPSPI